MTDLALAGAPAACTVPPGPHRAWLVAGATFLALLASAAAMGAPSVLILPLGREFGWDVATVSPALAVRLVAFGATGLLAPAAVNAWGVRRVACCGLALVGTGVMASLAMTRVWHLVLFWGVLVGAGSGLTSLVLGTSVAARWFEARRGLVIGLFGAATTAGQMLLLPALAAVAEAYGWRCCILMPFALLAVAAAAMAAFVPERPEAIGLLPYGARGPRPATVPPPAPAGARQILGEASRSGMFWALLGTFAVCGATTGGLVQTHLVPLCADLDVRPVQATGLLAGMGLLAFAGSTAGGWLSDRFDAGWLLFWFYGVRGLSLLCLPFTELSFAGLSLFAAVYGLDWIATAPPTARLALARFGRERAPMVFGLMLAGHQAGAAGAAYGAGLARVDLSSYLPSFLAAGALCLVAAAAVLQVAAGRDRPRRESAAAAARAGRTEVRRSIPHR